VNPKESQTERRSMSQVLDELRETLGPYWKDCDDVVAEVTRMRNGQGLSFVPSVPRQTEAAPARPGRPAQTI